MDESPLRAEHARLKAEVDKLQEELDIIGKEISRLQAKLEKEQRTLQAVRSSFSFQLGSMLIEAVRQPGRNTIFLPYRVLRLGVRAVRKTPPPSTPGKVAKKAYVLETVKDRINEIKQEMGCTSKDAAEPRRKDLKIAVIMDTFTYDCFKYEANLIIFTPENWKQVLSADSPDFLLVESCLLYTSPSPRDRS